jgi:hypothetical protein
VIEEIKQERWLGSMTRLFLIVIFSKDVKENDTEREGVSNVEMASGLGRGTAS